MQRLPARQKGASFIGTVILLALLGYAVYVGIQYVPQMIESKSIDSILGTVRDENKNDPITSVEDANAMVIRLLQVNEMNDMTDSFKVRMREDHIVIEFSYDRKLDLLYKVKPMHYEKTLRL
jgi:hypothetical protein